MFHSIRKGLSPQGSCQSRLLSGLSYIPLVLKLFIEGPITNFSLYVMQESNP
jgi:hypothetical protein